MGGKIAGYVFTVVIPVVIAAMLPHIGLDIGLPIILASVVVGGVDFAVMYSRKWHGSQKMVLILGMAAGALLLGGSAIAFFLQPKKVDQTHTSSATPTATQASNPVAELAALGWTVKPMRDSTTFEVNSSALPPMDRSAAYFKQLDKPFSLTFQQVKGIEGLHNLADIVGCSKIAISAGEFTDLSELRGFMHLTELGISQLPLTGHGTVDPAPLASLTNLETLSLGMTRIRTADFLSKLTRIKSLNLGQTLISDISAVSALPLLEKFDVRGARVTDLRPLEHTEYLSELSIDGNQISSVPSLAQLRNLKRLTLIEQQPFDLSPVAALTSLEALWMWGPFSGSLDASPLQRLTKLRELTLTGGNFYGTLTNVTRIESIGALTELRTLTFGHIAVAELNFIRNLRNLTELNLSQLPVTSIEPLHGLRLLRKLTMTSLAVTDISPLLDLSALTDLTIGRTPARADVIEELRRRGVNVTTY